MERAATSYNMYRGTIGPVSSQHETEIGKGAKKYGDKTTSPHRTHELLHLRANVLHYDQGYTLCFGPWTVSETPSSTIVNLRFRTKLSIVQVVHHHQLVYISAMLFSLWQHSHAAQEENSRTWAQVSFVCSISTWVHLQHWHMRKPLCCHCSLLRRR